MTVFLPFSASWCVFLTIGRYVQEWFYSRCKTPTKGLLGKAIYVYCFTHTQMTGFSPSLHLDVSSSLSVYPCRNHFSRTTMTHKEWTFVPFWFSWNYHVHNPRKGLHEKAIHCLLFLCKQIAVYPFFSASWCFFPPQVETLSYGLYGIFPVIRTGGRHSFC
jgi:hypothetical protein